MALLERLLMVVVRIGYEKKVKGGHVIEKVNISFITGVKDLTNATGMQKKLIISSASAANKHLCMTPMSTCLHLRLTITYSYCMCPSSADRLLRIFIYTLMYMHAPALLYMNRYTI